MADSGQPHLLPVLLPCLLLNRDMLAQNISVLCRQMECEPTTFIGGLSLLLCARLFDRKVLEWELQHSLLLYEAQFVLGFCMLHIVGHQPGKQIARIWVKQN